MIGIAGSFGNDRTALLPEDFATSRRKKTRSQAGRDAGYSLRPEESAERVGAGPEVLRRALLGAVTALLVARPLVLGEDPGLTDPLSDASNLVLTFLWLATAAGWAVWRAWSRQGGWYGSLLEAGLLGLVALVTVSAVIAAPYKNPAYLIAWEWLVLLVAFSLVRQLASTPGDNQRLLAALLSSAVSLSAYAIYQYSVEMPALRDLVREHPDQFSSAMVRRVQEPNVYATFSHPNAFAGYLALLTPAVVAAVVVCFRQRWGAHPPGPGARGRGAWQTFWAAGCALVVLAGLWLTHSRGAILGLLLVAVGFVIVRTTSARLRVAFILIVVLAVAGGGFYLHQGRPGSQALRLAQASLGKRLDYWKATWAMVTDPGQPAHFWLGVGPGNFGRFYPRYMSPTAFEQVKDPHNFLLEAWATSGLFAMLLLAGTLGYFFWGVLRPGLGSGVRGLGSAEGAGFATRWEFYLGGMAGLILGFYLANLGPASAPPSTDELLVAGRVAGARSIVWFASFALFETVAWASSMRGLVATAGLAALLLNLAVSGGISFPSVAQPLWVMAALAWNSRPARPPVGLLRGWFGVVFPLPALAAVAVVYFAFFYLPTSQCKGFLHQASGYYALWVQELDPQWREVTRKGLDMTDEDLIRRRNAVNRYNLSFVEKRILPPLRKALQADPTNVYPYLQLASWTGERWKLGPNMGVREEAARFARIATQVDPEGREGYRTEYQLNMLFAEFSQVGPATAEFYNLAAKAMAQVVKRDPTDATFHYLWADVLQRAQQPVEARLQAEEALRLDALATDPSRRLTESQRRQARQWVGHSNG